MEQLQEACVLWKKLFRTIEMIRNYNTKSAIYRPEKEISMTQVQIIGCVLFAPKQQVRVCEIADELGITPGAVSQQVERLVQIDLLVRKTDPNDRRAVCITLSEKGVELNRKLEVFFGDLFQRILGDVSPDKLAVFSELLDIMLERMHVENKKLKNTKEGTKK